jgi:hypothetical protein
MNAYEPKGTGRFAQLAALSLLGGGLVVAAAGWTLGWGAASSAGLMAEIYVLAEAGPNGDPAAAARGELRAGDTLHVSVSGEPASFLNLLYLGGGGEIALSRTLRDDPLPRAARGWTARFRVDDQPGEERLVAVVTRSPVAALGEWVEAANQAGGDPMARLAILKGILGDEIPAGTYAVRASPRFTHR